MGKTKVETKRIMDYEDTSRVLSQIWEADPKQFLLWIKNNQPMILEFLGKSKDLKDDDRYYD
jgi:hypothetical protein